MRLEPDDGADVGVIVTDGVMVKFDPVRVCPNELRGGPPAVSVAPPGNDDRVGGIALCRFGGSLRLIWYDGVDDDDDDDVRPLL